MPKSGSWDHTRVKAPRTIPRSSVRALLRGGVPREGGEKGRKVAVLMREEKKGNSERESRKAEAAEKENVFSRCFLFSSSVRKEKKRKERRERRDS